MKTTIDLPPDLIRSLAAEGIALPNLVVGLLRAYLDALANPPADESSMREWRDELL